MTKEVRNRLNFQLCSSNIVKTFHHRVQYPYGKPVSGPVPGHQTGTGGTGQPPPGNDHERHIAENQEIIAALSTRWDKSQGDPHLKAKGQSSSTTKDQPAVKLSPDLQNKLQQLLDEYDRRMESLKATWMGSLTRECERLGLPAPTLHQKDASGTSKDTRKGSGNSTASPGPPNGSGAPSASTSAHPERKVSAGATSNYDRSRDPRMRGR